MGKSPWGMEQAVGGGMNGLQTNEAGRLAGKVAAQLMKESLLRVLCPLEYARTSEIPLLTEMIFRNAVVAPARMLDMGSPQVLSGCLSRMYPDSELIYMNKFMDEIEESRVFKRTLKLNRLSHLQADARNPSAFPKESFDWIVSCSVLEHIEDIDGACGDAAAVANVWSWLKPGGCFAFSVPFSTSAFDEYTDTPSYGGTSSAAGRCFFQRFYDENTLRERILASSRFQVVETAYIGERYFVRRPIQERTARLFSRPAFRWLLGRWFPLLSKVFLIRAPTWQELKKPYLAFGVLRKPVG